MIIVVYIQSAGFCPLWLFGHVYLLVLAYLEIREFYCRERRSSAVARVKSFALLSGDKSREGAEIHNVM